MHPNERKAITNLQPNVFSPISEDPDYPTHKGYHNPKVRWNGWACPFFTYETASAMLKALQEEGYTWLYNKYDDAFVYRHEDTYPGEESRAGGTKCLVDGKEMTLYSIGGWEWTWDELEENR